MEDFIQNLNRSSSKRIDEIGINSQIMLEIDSLFTKLDEDQDDCISEEELFKALTSTSNGKRTIEETKNIFKTLDTNRNGKISREEFNEFMMHEIKQEIIDAEDEMEDLRERLHQLNLDGSGFMSSIEL